ncbi:substrate-binding periplasmic protein [Phytopseudomonas dryadis]|uniref:Amino acid ABC transporter substrate-binding protein n=1 Tax=Phytopseudomonas dryadis TaxID=2487520 RepID=A0ABY1Z6I5_9GAMM|nr:MULTISPECIES: transporter substrate-binding domain-containing protein [Pseudomonas]TBV05467.1 amino acid ABC transporter substrate-binding protein [Pseudomonas dryadis]TBV18476.1 amino acid ABC transporter substrate-binding protein [Pseudomonas sp. FRB 230]
MKWWAVGLLLIALDGVAQELRIGFGTHKPPYVFETEDKGLEYDIVIAAARAAGFSVRPYYAPMERLHVALSRGELDGITTTNRFDGVAAFYSQPYIHYHNVAVALASRNLSIATIADLGQYSVSAFQRARFLLGAEYRRMAEANPRYHEQAQQIARNRLLYSGRVEVVVADRRIFRYFNREVYDQVDAGQPIVEYPIFPATAYQLGLRDSQVRDRFDRGLASIRASGEYTEIERRYALY